MKKYVYISSKLLQLKINIGRSLCYLGMEWRKFQPGLLWTDNIWANLAIDFCDREKVKNIGYNTRKLIWFPKSENLTGNSISKFYICPVKRHKKLPHLYAIKNYLHITK